MKHFIVYQSLMYLFLCSQVPRTPIHILVLVPIDMESRDNYVTAISMATDMINQNENLLKEHQLIMHFRDTQRSRGHIMDSLYKAVKSLPPFFFVIGPVEVDGIDDVKDYLSILKIQMITFGTNLTNEYYYDFTWNHHRVAPKLLTFTKMKTVFLKHFQWKRAAIFYDFMLSQSLDSLVERFDSENISLIVKQDYFSGDTITLEEKIQELKTKDARIIIAEIGSGAAKVFCEVHKQNLKSPRFVWILRNKLEDNWYENNGGCTKEELLEAARNHFAFDFLPIRRDNNITIANITAREYMVQLIKQKQSDNVSLNQSENFATFYGSYAFDATWLVALTIQKSLDDGTLKNESFYQSLDWMSSWYLSVNLQTVVFQGITGKVSFTNYGTYQVGYRENDLLVFQYRKGLYREIGLYDSEKELICIHEEEKNVIFQDNIIPKDTMAIKEIFVSYDPAVFYTISVFTLFCVMLSIFFLIVNIGYGSHKVIRMSSPNVNSIILCGSLLAYLSIILKGFVIQRVNNAEDINNVVGWLGRASNMSLALGFTLTFGGFFAKTWRVYKIFTASAKLKKAKALSRNMFLLLLCFVIIDLLLFIAWNTLSPFEVEKKMLSQTEDLATDTIIMKFVNITASPYETEFYGAFLAYKGFILVFGLFLAWQTRHVSIDILNDSKSISIAVYNVAAISIIGVISFSALKDINNPQLMYMVFSSYVCLSTLISILIVFIPKVMLVFGRNKKEQLERTKSTFTLSTSMHSIYRSDAQAYCENEN